MSIQLPFNLYVFTERNRKIWINYHRRRMHQQQIIILTKVSYNENKDKIINQNQYFVWINIEIKERENRKLMVQYSIIKNLSCFLQLQHTLTIKFIFFPQISTTRRICVSSDSHIHNTKYWSNFPYTKQYLSTVQKIFHRNLILTSSWNYIVCLTLFEYKIF